MSKNKEKKMTLLLQGKTLLYKTFIQFYYMIKTCGSQSQGRRWVPNVWPHLSFVHRYIVGWLYNYSFVSEGPTGRHVSHAVLLRDLFSWNERATQENNILHMQYNLYSYTIMRKIIQCKLTSERQIYFIFMSPWLHDSCILCFLHVLVGYTIPVPLWPHKMQAVFD